MEELTATTSSRVNILYVITDLEMGGTEKKLVRLLTHLDRVRFRPVVVSLASEGPLTADLKRLDVPAYALHMNLLRFPSAMMTMAGVVRHYKIDLIHGFLFHGNMAGALVGMMTGRPVLWSLETQEGASWHHPCYRLLRFFPRRVCSVSETVRQFFRKKVGMEPDRLSVVGHGVAAAPAKLRQREEFDIPDRDFLVATASRLDPGKGIDDAIETVARLRREGHPVTLLVAGDGTLKASLERRVRELKVADHVRFLGWRDDVPELFTAADLVVHPSHLGEGMPNVVLEAMAAGRAVVATDAGGTREAVVDRETGFLVGKGDLQNLYDKMKNLMIDRDLLQRMGKEGKKSAEEHFSISRMVEGYAALYERLR